LFIGTNKNIGVSYWLQAVLQRLFGMMLAIQWWHSLHSVTLQLTDWQVTTTQRPLFTIKWQQKQQNM